MRKVLMLDVDGVLNVISDSYTTAKHSPHLIDAHLVSRLNFLCEKVPDLEIVISSSWRLDMDGLEEEIKTAGFSHWDRVIGKTTVAGSDAFLKRGEEIKKWADENIAPSFLSGVDGTLVILDDESEGIEEFWGKGLVFFETDPTTGLTDSIVKKLINRCQENTPFEEGK